MGNAQARQRIKPRDFDYLAKFTGFANEEVRGRFYECEIYITILARGGVF